VGFYNVDFTLMTVCSLWHYSNKRRRRGWGLGTERDKEGRKGEITEKRERWG